MSNGVVLGLGLGPAAPPADDAIRDGDGDGDGGALKERGEVRGEGNKKIYDLM